MSYNERTQLSNPVLATQKAKHVKAVKNDQVLCLTPRHVASHVIVKLPESNEGAHAEKSTFAAMVMVKHQLCHAKKKETVMLLQDPHHLKDLQSKASQVDGPATLSVVQWKVLHFQQLLKQRKQLLSQPI
nr:hypothetical protein Iba_chr14eCG7270 [Ipomoea batatas]